jgi:hypothetical protein
MNDHSAHTDHEHSSGHGGSSDNDHKEPPRQYFLPGKILVHLEHPAGIDPRDLARLINGHLLDPVGEVGEVRGLGLADHVEPVRLQNIHTFPRPESQMSTFSIAPIELKRADQNKLVDILLYIINEHQAQPFNLGGGVIWQSVSPNWLLGSATHGSTHPPSPGSWPLAKRAPKEKDWKFSLIESDPNNPRELPFATEKGANVHIAILDTAPSAIDLDEAYETWHAKNPLINQLLKPEPNRKLRLVTDIYAEIELLDCSLARHRYWMADHGLFIAGEIASIAPESTIHLIKVFSSYGSASTLTLAQGLIRLLSDEEIGRPLIVNCSFGLAAPDPNDPNFAEELQDSDFPEGLRDIEILRHMQTSLQALFDELTDQPGVIVVAAAGDDSDPQEGRAPARLPAAYDNIIGVGALPKEFSQENGRYKAASYSNLADNPPDTGYMTLGGETGHGKGILGLYTSEFPDYTGAGGKPPKDPKESTRNHLKYSPNEKEDEGNVEWAGASFAAPIITGLVANWCSQQPAERADDPNEQAITVENVRLALNRISQAIRADANERVILVKQG